MNGQVNLHMCNIAVHAGRKDQELSNLPKLGPIQKALLEAAFLKGSYLNQTTLKQLAQQTDISEEKILLWFSWKITKIRNERKGETLPTSKYI